MATEGIWIVPTTKAIVDVTCTYLDMDTTQNVNMYMTIILNDS